MSKCFLLGAGASSGCHHEESPPSNQQPPLGNWLFGDGYESGLLTEKEFSVLLGEVKRYANIKNDVEDIDDLAFNAEIFLRRLDKHMDDTSVNRNIKREIRNHVFNKKQKAVSESYYYFYELFRRYSNRYKPQSDNYTSLARYADSTNSAILSLNYDVMFEKAVREVNLDYHYKGLKRDFYHRQHPSQSIPLLKLHGSINWISPFGYGVGSSGINDFEDKIRTLHRNRLHVEPEYMSFDQLRSTSYKDLVFSRDVVYEPAIIPPIEAGKDYEKIQIYEDIWSTAKRYLERTSELVVIGSQVTPQDSKLLDLIGSSLEKGTTVTIASRGSSDDIQSRLANQFGHLNVETNGLGFSEYMDSL